MASWKTSTTHETVDGPKRASQGQMQVLKSILSAVVNRSLAEHLFPKSANRIS